MLFSEGEIPVGDDRGDVRGEGGGRPSPSPCGEELIRSNVFISFFRIKKSETSKLYSPKLISKNQNIKISKKKSFQDGAMEGQQNLRIQVEKLKNRKTVSLIFVPN